MDMNQESPKRGRPKSVVRWPEGRFTFKQLLTENASCDSLLRRRVREGVQTGEVLKVSSMQLAKTGRPETVYQKATNQATNMEIDQEERWTQTQQESTGTSTLSS